jgi:single-stranded-DNA-specific exonuclease
MGRLNPALGRRWITRSPQPEAEALLSRELGLSPLLSRVVAGRGHALPEAAARFLNPRLEDLHSPRLLPDYAPARDVILNAREKGDLIYIHGDYDVDGVTSAALFTRFLAQIGCRIVPHVPHRMKEGYGIHHMAVQWAAEKGSKVFLTCDCGVSAHEQIVAARGSGMIPVITDHHELKDTLPDAAAVMNPHREDIDPPYPFPTLSGVGVVFKFCAGLTQEIGFPLEKYYRAYLDLAVLGTVADVMPLVNENRIIARHGLPALAASAKKGIRALLRVADLDQPETRLTPRSIGFQLGPRINAVGRIDDAAIALDLLLTKDWDEALAIAQHLDSLNHERRSETALMVQTAGDSISREGLDAFKALVVSHPGWHPGIIGLVASRLVESHYRPSFVIAVGSDGVGKGSARSVPGFHLAEALREAEKLILGGGGHEMAAGFSLRAENIPAFRELMAARADRLLKDEDLVPVMETDAEATIAQAGPALAEELAQLEPFGNANEEPLFIARGLRLGSISRMRTPQHAKLTLTDGASTVPGVIFNQADEAAALASEAVDVAFVPEFNTYRGSTEFRWRVEDIQPSS